jgi:hypothetical protein
MEFSEVGNEATETAGRAGEIDFIITIWCIDEEGWL